MAKSKYILIISTLVVILCFLGTNAQNETAAEPGNVNNNSTTMPVADNSNNNKSDNSSIDNNNNDTSTLAPTTTTTTTTPEPTTTIIATLDGKHVMIGPPQNVMAMLTTDTQVTVLWDAPTVYFTHDFSESSNVVTRHEHFGSYKSETMEDEEKCQPLKYFSTFAITGQQKDLIVDSDGRPIHHFNFTAVNARSTRIPMTVDDKIVSYENGCLKNFDISWKESEDRLTTPSKRELKNDETVFPITGLKAQTDYEITVTANYVSGDSISTSIHITTKAINESTCACKNNKECSGQGAEASCDCGDKYIGQFCQTCSFGHFSPKPSHDCYPCPCNTQTSQLYACHMREGFLQCAGCDTGYVGNLCQHCDTGYYRAEETDHCVPCFCNGHAGDNTTSGDICKENGDCIACQHNTAGPRCDKCLDGFVRSNPADLLSPCEWSGWKSEGSSKVSPGAVAAVAVIVVLLVVIVVIVLWFRKNRAKRTNWKFWTVEMKRDQDDVDFQAVHDDDVDDLNFYDQQGRLSASNKYSRLSEDC